MKPIELFHQIFFVYIYKCQQIVGSTLCDADFKPWLLTYSWMGLIWSYIGFCVYTFATYDIETCWKCLCVSPLAIQGLVKYGMLLSFYKDMHLKVATLNFIYKVNSVPGTANYKILQKWSTICLFVCKFGTLTVLCTFIFFIPYTLFYNYITDKREPIMPVYIYGFDEATFFGYLALSFYHLMLLCLSFAGTVCADLLLVMLVIHMWPMTEIVRDMFDQMNVSLKAGRLEGNIQFEVFFRNILMVHKEVCRYIAGIAEIYYYTAMCEVYTDAAVLCVGIYCILSIKAVQLYLFILLIFLKFLLFCALGTIVETTTDHMYEIIINSNWHMMPRKQQKMMILMIARAQNPSILMAGTIPLNLDTFVNVMKTVYSVGMILMETVV